jgi:hypothetical protein
MTTAVAMIDPGTAVVVVVAAEVVVAEVVAEEVVAEEAAAVLHHHQMLWQVTKEKVRAMYRHEGLQQNPPWMEPLPLGRLRFTAPDSEAAVRARVQREVGADLGLVPRVAREGLLVRWSGKKRDRVDEILVRELQVMFY